MSKEDRDDCICIPWDIYEELLDRRMGEVFDLWGNKDLERLYPKLKELIRECPPAPEYTDPRYIIDNYLVNSEVVDRKGFTEDGEWMYYWKAYGGSWEDLCDNAVFSDDKAACMNTGL